MSTLPPPAAGPIVYPDSDGQRMADNTLQWDWIAKLKGNLESLFLGRPDVFVAGDLLWYPVEGEPGIRAAPDVMVAFGRPKGYRGSYKQWEEGGVPVTVAFEILSPGNSEQEMIDKQLFYEEHGVEEYYVYDPEGFKLEVYLRRGSVFRREHRVAGFVSPLLKVRFEPAAAAEMQVFYPNGEPFLLLEHMATRYEDEKQRADDERKRAEDALKRADGEKKRAEDERKRAEDEKQRAEDEKQRADGEKKRAEDERKRAEDEKQRAEDERKRAEDEKQRAEDASRRADGEKKRAEDERKRAEDEKQRAEDERKRAEEALKLADDEKKRASALTRILELSRKARRGQATADELAELERLEDGDGRGAP